MNYLDGDYMLFKSPVTCKDILQYIRDNLQYLDNITMSYNHREKKWVRLGLIFTRETEAIITIIILYIDLKKSKLEWNIDKYNLLEKECDEIKNGFIPLQCKTLSPIVKYLLENV